MFAAVSIQLEHGGKSSNVKSHLGQVLTDHLPSGPVLRLWPPEFLANVHGSRPYEPIATLWEPKLGAVLHATLFLRGLERVREGRRVRWVLQRWECEPLSFAALRERLDREEHLQLAQQRIASFNAGVPGQQSPARDHP
jgi:hypothetical protein